LGQDASGVISHLAFGGGGEVSPQQNYPHDPGEQLDELHGCINNKKKPVLADTPTNFEVLQEQKSEPGY
jgi:hypothetical protein